MFSRNTKGAHTRVTVAASALVAFLLGACSEAPPRSIAHLINELDAAEIQLEPTLLDLGTAAARGALRDGWYYDETAGSTGRSFIWSRGESSSLVFFLSAKRDIELEFNCSPLTFSDAPIQVVTITINGADIREVPLKRRWQSYRITLPAAAQTVGRNTLEFRYRYHRAPAEVRPGNDDRRRLAVAWDTIRFRGTAAGEVKSDGDRLVLPPGSRVDFFLEVPGDAALTSAAVDVDPAATGGLRITVTEEGRAERELVTVRDAAAPFERSLDVGAGLCRLRFEIAHTDNNQRPATLTAPQLRSPSGNPVIDRPEPRGTSGPGRPSTVIVYLVDALRADRLGCSGFERPVSPELDAFAADAVVYENAIAQSSWTKAAMASMFAGLWPGAHGVHGPEDRLPEELTTLPEVLQDAGFRSAAIVANAYVGERFGFGRGFEHFTEIPHTTGTSEEVHRHALEWLDTIPPDDQVFLYLHTIDPHAPYAPPEPYRSTFASAVQRFDVGSVDNIRPVARGERRPEPGLRRDLLDLYDGEIAHNDASFGKLLDELRARGRYDDALIVFTSDHGEAFGEHGSWTHGLDLYDEVLRIPLVVRFPGGFRSGTRHGATVQQVDLLPTVLELTGTEVGQRLEGRSLTDVDLATDRPAFSSLEYWERRATSVVAGRYKLIRPDCEELGYEIELYDLRNDPGESRNLARSRPIRTGFLDGLLRRQSSEQADSVRAVIDDETRRRLEGLGYLGD